MSLLTHLQHATRLPCWMSKHDATTGTHLWLISVPKHPYQWSKYVTDGVFHSLRMQDTFPIGSLACKGDHSAAIRLGRWCGCGQHLRKGLLVLL